LRKLNQSFKQNACFRFKEDSGDIARLREKEKGDWKKLTKETLPKILLNCLVSPRYGDMVPYLGIS
jgi:hypothetical protein